ncbi:MAG: hypothetical protein MR992_04505 [Lachnospiraceae bacterium]|nr:hypothetical protein [Lachnospiraceae bacterium]MDD7627098.1 hypothetical protein [Lachnospiraceae bacterium]MDY4118985.1 hypothetical protein [Lachnospiraceae bacterium]
MIDLEEIFDQKNSDQSCTAIETEKELFLYKLKERDSAISEIKRVGNTILIGKNDKQIVLRGDNLITRKQASKIIIKSIKAQKDNEENISAYILMPHIIGKGRCQINSKRATTSNYYDNPCFFLEKLRNAYQSAFEIENPDKVEEWIIKEENVLFWEMWGKKENGYIAYLEDFCLSFLPKMKEKYSVFFDDNWKNESWDSYNGMLSEFHNNRKEEIEQRYNLIFR